MDDAARKRLRELAERATPGPWIVQEWRRWAEPSKSNFTIQYTATDDYNRGTRFALARVELYGSGDGSSDTNAAFIAAASPSAVLDLLDEIDAWHAAERKRGGR